MNAIDPGSRRRSLTVPRPINAPLDPSAEVMIALLAPMLTRLARRYESDEHRCGDLRQEMLIALWLSLHGFDGRSSFRGWVNSVAHRIGLQHVAERRVNRRTERLSGNLQSLPGLLDPESMLAARERARTLLHLLSGLRPREREALLLHLQEFELDEVSQAMRICRTQARETLNRARRRLMMRMKKTELQSSYAKTRRHGCA